MLHRFCTQIILYIYNHCYRIEHTEVRHSGQAFHLGRYSIHFHLSGSMNGSYIRHCSIHHSFNRAISVHGVHNLLIERNVAYDIMGHAYFLVSTPGLIKPQYTTNHALMAPMKGTKMK